MPQFHPNKIVSTTDITPYSRNARGHSEAQIAQISASIRAFGFTNPLLIDEQNGLIAGHGRLAAARLLGLTELPAIVVAGLSEAERQALRIADNKLALNASWDDDLLRTELLDLRVAGFDLSLTGFGDDELLGLFAEANAGLTDPDEVPEPPAEPVSKLGDVWLLGRHRLVCGDATSEVDVSLALGGVRPHLMVTDPPYGVDYDPTWRRGIRNTFADVKADGLVTNDSRADWSAAWALFPGDVVYVWHGALHATEVAASLAEFQFMVRAQIIWAKQMAPITRGDYRWQHEPCWYAVRKGKVGHFAGDRNQTTLWQIANLNSVGGRSKDAGDQTDKKHGTQKPVECMRRPIENNSSAGQAVYDPFVGSGTTIIAAEMTGRAAHCLEISPAYVDVAILRWQAFTGQTATRPDGTPYQAAHGATVQAD